MHEPYPLPFATRRNCQSTHPHPDGGTETEKSSRGGSTTTGALAFCGEVENAQAVNVQLVQQASVPLQRNDATTTTATPHMLA